MLVPCRRRMSAAAGVSVGARGGAQNSAGWSRLASANPNLSPLSRASVKIPVAVLPLIARRAAVSLHLGTKSHYSLSRKLEYAV
jgi:hypothetical protein